MAAYNSTACLVASITFGVLAWLSIFLRLYARVYLGKGPFVDDVLAVAAMMICTGLVVVNSIMQQDGLTLAEHIPSQIPKAVKFTFASYILYATGTYIIKMSFTWTLHRVVQTRPQSIILGTVAITGTVLIVGVILQVCLFCRPVSHLWGRFYDPPSKGSCHALWTLEMMLLMQASWILLADITLGLVLPTMLLWNVQMHRRIKFSVRFLLGLSALAVVATIIRIPYLAIGNEGRVFILHDAMALWSVLELAISIIGTSATTWRPLAVKFGIIESGDTVPQNIKVPSTHSPNSHPSPYQSTGILDEHEAWVGSSDRTSPVEEPKHYPNDVC